MAFWEELGKTITDMGKETTKKAKELTEVIQYKSQLSAEKTKIQEAYAAIGKLYYEENKENQDETYEEAFAWVTESLSKVKTLEEEISKLEGCRVCAECGCKVAREDSFCRRCGAPMAPVKEEFETDAEEGSEEPETESSDPESVDSEPTVTEETQEEDIF